MTRGSTLAIQRAIATYCGPSSSLSMTRGSALAIQSLALALGLSVPVALVAEEPARARAEALAARADSAPSSEAVNLAQRALAATEEFDPTDFVPAGRKGEVMDDAYQAAREAYRIHRAVLYAALGRAELSSGNAISANRHLQRAYDLSPTGRTASDLARALVARGRASEALSILLSSLSRGNLDLALAGEVADALGLPSLQAELDRVRLLALAGSDDLGGSAPEPRAGLITLPGGIKLSTGAPPRLDGPGVKVLYVAAPGCRNCSRDLDALGKAVSAEVKVLVVPERVDDDLALRQTLRLYRRDWPVLYGAPVSGPLRLHGGQSLVVGREGWSGAVVEMPFQASVPQVVAILSREDVSETRPRASWNRRAVEPVGPVTRPMAEPEGLLPGEDTPAPPEWTTLVESLRAGRLVEAQAALDALSKRDDAWMLGPELRVNRAVLLAARGRRDEARHLLLRVGDSRFEKEVDSFLEGMGSPGRKD